MFYDQNRITTAFQSFEGIDEYTAIAGMKADFDAYTEGEVRRDDVTMMAIAPRLA